MTINGNNWAVVVHMQNGQTKTLTFASQLQAQRDIALHGYGILVPPGGVIPQRAGPPSVTVNVSFGRPTVTYGARVPAPAPAPAPAAQPQTGWVKVTAGSKSWKFNNPVLAQRCAAATGGTISSTNQPDRRWIGAANPVGPTYT